jgi:hypothetical protein
VAGGALEQGATQDLCREESWAASLSRLRMACLRVIDNDDTTTKGLSQYIFQKKCFGTHDAAGSFGGRLGRGRSIPQTATHRAHENKEHGVRNFKRND